MSEPHLWFFRRLALHDRVPSVVWRGVASHGRVERWGHRADVHITADAADVLIVYQGNVDLEDGSGAGRVRLKRGDIFGALAAPEPGRADLLRAYDHAEIVSLPRAAFERECAPHLEGRSITWGALRQHSASVPTHTLFYTSALVRLCKALLHFAETQGQVQGEWGSFAHTIPERPLRELLGLDAPHVRAALERLRLEGLVEIPHRRQTVLPRMDELRAHVVRSS